MANYSSFTRQYVINPPLFLNLTSKSRQLGSSSVNFSWCFTICFRAYSGICNQEIHPYSSCPIYSYLALLPSVSPKWRSLTKSGRTSYKRNDDCFNWGKEVVKTSGVRGREVKRVAWVLRKLKGIRRTEENFRFVHGSISQCNASSF